MTIFTIALILLALVALAGTVVAVLRDGYHRAPICPRPHVHTGH